MFPFSTTVLINESQRERSPSQGERSPSQRGQSPSKIVSDKKPVRRTDCYYAERAFLKCMKNTKDDMNECVNLMDKWNNCMENYYASNNK